MVCCHSDHITYYIILKQSTCGAEPVHETVETVMS